LKEENLKGNTVMVLKLLTSTALLINHPGRNHALQYIYYHSVAATPPSKGGETSSILSCNKTMLKLTAKG
jgi:hypothetical protein